MEPKSLTVAFLIILFVLYIYVPAYFNIVVILYFAICFVIIVVKNVIKYKYSDDHIIGIVEDCSAIEFNQDTESIHEMKNYHIVINIKKNSNNNLDNFVSFDTYLYRKLNKGDIVKIGYKNEHGYFVYGQSKIIDYFT